MRQKYKFMQNLTKGFSYLPEKNPVTDRYRVV